MSTEILEQAINETRSVLANVDATQLDLATPCDQWKVRDLIDHIVGAQHFFLSGLTGAPPQGGEGTAEGDFVAAYDAATTEVLAAFKADGAMEKMCTLPFGQMPGVALAGLAATDTFTHGWDLAKATGQSTDLSPQLAAGLLAAARTSIQPAFRSEDGAVFGLEQDAPAGANAADQLAAFLGRRV